MSIFEKRFIKKFMHKKILVTLFVFYSVIDGFAQTKISGKIVNEENDQPVASASIYFNNTSIGTTSNTNGQFLLYNSSAVNTDLIVSCVGFETIVYKLTSNENDKTNFIFKLSPKENTLKDVMILTKSAREKWLTVFRDNFLGVTGEGQAAKIENEDAIYFISGESKNSMYAYADVPLIILNNKLGYKIHFQLLVFNVGESKNTTYFYGYTRYEELGEKKRWVKNRRNCYYGSTMHFYRSFIANKLTENDFEVFFVKTPKQDSSNGADKNQLNAVSTISKIEPLKIMKIDSINITRFIITCPEKLMVLYKKNTYNKSYIVFKLPELIIDKNGIPMNPLDVYYIGLWSYEKAANLLPYNYNPD